MRRTRSILVVEDDAATADIIRLYAEHEGYSVTVIADGQAGLSHALTQGPDLVVLDLMLPGLDGVSVCRRLRADSEAPVIMLTARSTEDDKIIGLEAGADDYVVKPFSPRELIARIEAVLRRGVGRRRSYAFEGLSLDVRSHQVFVDDLLVALTPAEFDLLEAFCRSPGVVLTRAQLVEQAFGFDYDGMDRTIDAHIAKLRKKVKRTPPRDDFIVTVFGVGYRFVGRPPHA
jgi:two-component system alkaline phosphatase synthesis response regulator PhoP